MVIVESTSENRSSEHQSLLSDNHDKQVNPQIHSQSSIPILQPSSTYGYSNNNSEVQINPNFDAAAASPIMYGNGQQQPPPQTPPSANLQIKEQRLDPYYSSRVTSTSMTDLCCSSGVSLFLVLFIIAAAISQIVCELVVYPNYLDDTLVQVLPRVLVYLPLGLAILYYIILVLSCSTAKYLYNNSSASSIYDNVDRLTKARPVISLHVSCYHYETRYETYTDNEGKTQTRTHTETVTTYMETRPFIYNYFRDVSKPFLLEGTNKKYMKLKLRQVTFMNNSETKIELDNARRRIQVENRWRDDYMNYNESWSLDTTFTTNMLAKIKPEESSFFVSLPCYLLFSLFGLNSIYRFIFNRMCDTQEHLFVKEISVSPFPEQFTYVQQPVYNAGYSSVYGQGVIQSSYGLNQTEYRPPTQILPQEQYGGSGYIPYQQQSYQKI